MDAFNWIAGFHKAGHGFRYFKDLLPDVFERYFVLPKAAGIIDDFPFTEYPAGKDSIENLNRQHEIERRFGLFLNNDAENKYRAVSLKELAERFNVTYGANTVQHIGQTPGITILYEQTKASLHAIIALLSGTEALRLFIQGHSRYEGSLPEWGVKPDHTMESPADYIHFQELTFWDSTSYLFTESLNWVVCTLEDYDHLILGINQALYTNLLKLEGLELFEIRLNDPIC